ncbi:hypothetical protein GGR55DRAFT_674617 [Xylaria sp. FL0064]|nr:hypothetical protein GGR55DRAFT_674617 [Xylaria sp. FL0064]
MSRKSVLSAVSASNGAFEAAARRIAGQQHHRSFTSTPQRNANITHFTPTSSPAIDSLLNDIRTKIILPSYLPKAQRKKIYSRKWEKKLQADPIIIEIDGEVLKFRYQNPLTDLPAAMKSMGAAITQFQTAADFANLKPLLEGVHYAGRKIHPSFAAKILRLVGAKGRVYDMIDCARSVRRTGYKLDTSEKVNMLLHYVQMKARDADWDVAETRQALRWADLVIELLHEEAHQPRRRKSNPVLPGEIPLKRDPMVLAAPLHLAAILAARHKAGEPILEKAGEEQEVGEEQKAAEEQKAGEEILEKVHKLARDIVALWPEDRKMKELQPDELYTDFDNMGYLLQPEKFVTLATPLLHGLETAVKVLEPELASELQTRCDTLKAEVLETQADGMEIKKARVLAAETEEERAQLSRELRSEEVYKKFYGS